MFRSVNKISPTSLILSFLLILQLTTYPQSSGQSNIIAQKYDEVTLFSTEKRSIHSEIVNDNFEIYISLPYKYPNTDTTYPVLLLLSCVISKSPVGSRIEIERCCFLLFCRSCNETPFICNSGTLSLMALSIPAVVSAITFKP